MKFLKSIISLFILELLININKYITCKVRLIYYDSPLKYIGQKLFYLVEIICNLHHFISADMKILRIILFFHAKNI